VLSAKIEVGLERELIAVRLWHMDHPVDATELAPPVLKGFHHPIAAIEIHRWRDHAEGGFVRSVAAGRTA
jgi:hypothetical protein